MFTFSDAEGNAVDADAASTGNNASLRTGAGAARVCWPNPHSFDSQAEFELVGMLIGLAIRNSVILNLAFPTALYAKLLGRPTTLRDYVKAFPADGQALLRLLQFDGDVEHTYCATFSIEETVWGETKTVPLCPGGQDIPVTNANRGRYVELKVDYLLNKSIERSFAPFRAGFLATGESPVLDKLSPEELQRIVCGAEELDFGALERVARYTDGYTSRSPIVAWIWRLLHELSPEDKKRFLAFATGSDRAPVAGLGDLVLTFTRGGPDCARLPTAHTCFNHICIPEYSSEEKFRTLMLKAITYAEGFGLL